MYVLLIFITLAPLLGEPYYQMQIVVPSKVQHVVGEKDKNAECRRLIADIEKAFVRRFKSKYDDLDVRCERVLSDKERIL